MINAGNPESPLPFTYDTCENRLYTPTGEEISPEKGGQGKRMLLVNMVMGTACNYHCGYCCQSGMTVEPLTSKRLDVFLQDLHDYCDRHFKSINTAHILYWGGEPLLYFNLMREARLRVEGIEA